MAKLYKNNQVRVHDDASHHGGRIGYFRFWAKGEDGEYDIAVLSETQNEPQSGRVMFAVDREYVSLVEEDED